MATIAFFPDLEEGHLFPTFGLARSLADRGHDVHYIGIIQNREAVLKFGFSYHVIFNEEFPEDFMEEFKARFDEEAGENQEGIDHISLMIADSIPLDNIIAEIQPDILITTAFIQLETLILHYRFYIPQVVLNPMVRKPVVPLIRSCIDRYLQLPGKVSLEVMNFFNQRKKGEFKSITDMVAPLGEIPELILCPKEMVLPQWEYDSNVHFIEPSIRKEALLPGPSTLSLDIPEGRQVIFASMGSQAFRFKAPSKHFYATVLEVMRANLDKDWHVLLVINAEFQVEEFGEIPGNVTVLDWAPQIEILNISSLVITHGGLGTVKESIFFGVPMIVLPLGRDQFDNAKHVQHHQLGIEMDLENLKADELEANIDHLLTSSDIRDSVGKMKALFREKEEAQIGAKFIEGLI
ncbi:MAG: glycosyltransferase family 1 protein [bacterium]|nr:glycosyltransferase family 1 protein [bacterium]